MRRSRLTRKGKVRRQKLPRIMFESTLMGKQVQMRFTFADGKRAEWFGWDRASLLENLKDPSVLHSNFHDEDYQKIPDITGVEIFDFNNEEYVKLSKGDVDKFMKAFREGRSKTLTWRQKWFG